LSAAAASPAPHAACHCRSAIRNATPQHLLLLLQKIGAALPTAASQN
jgi:hypothetical protein